MKLFFLVCGSTLIFQLANAFSCSDFEEGACDLSENNIVGHDRFTNTPSECQSKCKMNPDCQWFTHFDTQCYMLAECGNTDSCGGCVSGPTEPDFSTCPWPPVPGPDTTTTTSGPVTTTTTQPQPGGCENFQQGTCELQENNIITTNTNTNTASECQDKCIAQSGCLWFTHFDTYCYMLDHCGTLSNCDTCVSGPTTPDIDTCPWPPHPDVSTTTTTSTTTTPTTTTPTTTTSTTTSTSTTTTPTTTTMTTTTATTTRITSRTPLQTTTTTTRITSRTPLQTTTTTTTTKKTTTTTQLDGNCDDIKINEECDWNYGLVSWYENVMTGNQCQIQCRSVAGAKYFSHYNEGAHGEHGFCGCFSTCAWPTHAGCRSSCSTHETWEADDLFEESSEIDKDSSETFGLEQEVELNRENQPRPGPHYCHCMHGPLHPSIEDCGIWPDIF